VTRTTIRQFRAALADTADESTLMRAYRRSARTPRYVAERVGGEWAVWPPAAETRGFADWPVWNESAAAPAQATPAAHPFADWPVWNESGAARQQATAGGRALGDWSTWQGAALAGRA
jgi:hypothetical protein